MTPPINDAVNFAIQNLNQMHSVEDWAKEYGYSNAKSFSKYFRNHFQKRPSKVLIQLKIEHALKLLSEKNCQKNYCIAQEIGLPDEQALYKFFKYHTGYSPSDFKDNLHRYRG